MHSTHLQAKASAPHYIPLYINRNNNNNKTRKNDRKKNEIWTLDTRTTANNALTLYPCEPRRPESRQEYKYTTFKYVEKKSRQTL